MTVLCDRHDQAVAMRRVTGDRFVRLVDPDGKPGPSVDTGTGPDHGLFVCPLCGLDSTHPNMPRPVPER